MPPKPKSNGDRANGDRYLRPPKSQNHKRGRRYLTPFGVFVKNHVKSAKKGTEVPDPSVPCCEIN